jgi:glutathione peroxidase-family protein
MINKYLPNLLPLEVCFSISEISFKSKEEILIAWHYQKYLISTQDSSITNYQAKRQKNHYILIIPFI